MGLQIRIRGYVCDQYHGIDSHKEGEGWGGEFRLTREGIQYAPVTVLEGAWR